MSSVESLRERLSDRLVQVSAFGIVTVAFMGLIAGTRQQPPERGYAVPKGHPAVVASAARTAPGYLDWRKERHGPNATQYEQAFAALRPETDLFAVVEKSDTDHEDALSVRSLRRAYDGAPPTIPHQVDAVGTNECLACHRDGARIFDRTAPRMSHAEYAVCTQCHVPEQSEVPSGPPLTDNAFAGLSRSGRGQRAWTGAPPTIPHPTNMRSECGSCHGPLGPLGLRTTHPSRLSCTQCHAPSAELDQRGPPSPVAQLGAE